MDLPRRLSFLLWYVGRPPWDSGIVPPEVEEFIQAHPTGSGLRQTQATALDLGCGTGTSSLALASAGWSVTGVDFVPRAIRLARRKALKARLAVDFRLGDVTRLDSLPGPFDLVLDIGCFHGLSASGKARYLDHLQRLLAPAGTWLLYGFFKPDEAAGPGFVEADLASAGRRWDLVERRDGVDKKDRPSAWFWFRNRPR